jgi:hypothetical protein
MLDIKAQAVIDAHVLIRYPHESKKRDQVPSPVRIEQLEARDKEKYRGHVVAEAVFTSEKVKKLSAKDIPGAGALFLAVLSRLPEDLFVRHSPCDGSNGNSQNQKPRGLQAQRHHGEVGCTVQDEEPIFAQPFADRKR